MKFFVDTAEIDAIAELNDLGMVDGVTTNPSLILKSGRDILEVTKEICDLVAGPVSAEVVALEADAMIAEGRKLAGIAEYLSSEILTSGPWVPGGTRGIWPCCIHKIAKCETH